MRLKLAATLLAFTATVLLPAAADYNRSANVNAAYERGRASSLPAQTANEMIRCGAYWYVWDQFHGGVYDDVASDGYNSALTGAQAKAVIRTWWDRANETLDDLSYDEGLIAVVAERFVAEAWNGIQSFADKISYIYVEILGACALPTEED